MAPVTNSIILPKILETLSAKPDLCDTVDNLCDEIEHYVTTENPDVKIIDIHKAIRKALQVGQSLGIVTVTNEKIRMPFSLRVNEKTMAASASAMEEDEVEDEETNDIDAFDDVDNARKIRRKSRTPRKSSPLTATDLQYVMMDSKRRHHITPNDRVGRRRASSSRRQRRGRATRRGKVSRRRVSRRRR